MKLVLFLGAGVSKQSGLPVANQLTQMIFKLPYHQEFPGHFRAGRHKDHDKQKRDITPRIRRLLRLMLKHDTQDIARVGYCPVRGRYRSSGAIYRGVSTYEDLFFLCQRIKLWNIGLADNSLTTPFMESIERRARGILVGRSIKARMCDLGTLGDQACTLIETIVAGALSAQVIIGLDLIRELSLAPDLTQLNIVTLNHDTLVEQFLAGHGVQFVDGFGDPDGDVRWHDDRIYESSRARVRVFKLHGSVNWHSFSVAGQSRPAILLEPDIARAKDGAGMPLKSAFRGPSFLSGLEKAVSYQRGIYADMHFRFHEVLRQCSLMLMSGYGWGDTAINFQIETWIDKTKANSLILLHQHPEELVERSLIMASSYDGWTACGSLVPIRKWLSDVSLSELTRYLVRS